MVKTIFIDIGEKLWKTKKKLKKWLKLVLILKKIWFSLSMCSIVQLELRIEHKDGIKNCIKNLDEIK
jgi:hypothetical protein